MPPLGRPWGRKRLQLRPAIDQRRVKAPENELGDTQGGGPARGSGVEADDVHGVREAQKCSEKQNETNSPTFKVKQIYIVPLFKKGLSDG